MFSLHVGHFRKYQQGIRYEIIVFPFPEYICYKIQLWLLYENTCINVLFIPLAIGCVKISSCCSVLFQCIRQLFLSANTIIRKSLYLHTGIANRGISHSLSLPYQPRCPFTISGIIILHIGNIQTSPINGILVLHFSFENFNSRFK